MNLRTFTPVAYLIAALGVIALLTLGYCTVTGPARQAAKMAAANQTKAEGRTGAAQDASGVRDRADQRTSEIDTAVKGGTDEIRNAPDDASAGAAALHSLCRLNPGADPRCRVLNHAPGRVG